MKKNISEITGKIEQGIQTEKDKNIEALKAKPRAKSAGRITTSPENKKKVKNFKFRIKSGCKKDVKVIKNKGKLCLGREQNPVKELARRNSAKASRIKVNCISVSKDDFLKPIENIDAILPKTTTDDQKRVVFTKSRYSQVNFTPKEKPSNSEFLDKIKSLKGDGSINLFQI
uniref:Uncharacterized protein n=1 Tax=Euplotes crassus TaxID=5936 RepID=A0A7S3NXI7_EUPCR|mmetsp:Transcript_4698/g.4392  ORF Transcript_4698/g.4392 Transcript_4698/m.4392 type:complete len:172 (+) Transcript_4698:468-983(+)